MREDASSADEKGAFRGGERDSAVAEGEGRHDGREWESVILEGGGKLAGGATLLVESSFWRGEESWRIVGRQL